MSLPAPQPQHRKSNKQIEEMLIGMQGEHMQTMNQMMQQATVQHFKRVYDRGWMEAEAFYKVGQYAENN